MTTDSPDNDIPVEESDASHADAGADAGGSRQGGSEDTEDDLNVDVFESELDATVGQGYDLDQGHPLSESGDRDRRRGGKARAIESAKEFFSVELLYRFDILEDQQRDAHRGTYRFDIKGQNGGVWTVTIADDLQVVSQREEAELVVTANINDFLTIINGDINPQLAILAGKLKFHGDMRKSLRLLELISPDGD